MQPRNRLVQPSKDVEQPQNHLMQPTVDIGWRQLIFCYVATKLMQPRNRLVQPTVDIAWRQSEGQGHRKLENHSQPVKVSFLVVSAKNVLSRCLVSRTGTTIPWQDNQYNSKGLP